MKLTYPLPQAILNGTMDITDNLEFVRQAMSLGTPNLRIVSIDEDNILPKDHYMVIGGACLIPPMDALIAEADGDEQLFDMIYANHLNDGFVEQFCEALLMFLHNGGNVLFYHPELQGTIGKKFVQHFYVRFGIQVGLVGITPCLLDPKYIPAWLSILYMNGCMHPFELLYFYPLDALIPDPMMTRLLMEIRPIGKDYTSQVNYILSLRGKLKQNPYLIVPMHYVPPMAPATAPITVTEIA